jgi:mRNA-degrading endonuclease RelE of RelBE toxin-antitoxin system
MIEKFRVEFLPESVKFLDNLDNKPREKIYYNIRKTQITNDPELFKKLTTNIWEFRTLYDRFYYRLFAFWDKLMENKQSF